MADETYCRYCGRLIRYLRTAAGKNMPCDAERVRLKDSLIYPDGAPP